MSKSDKIGNKYMKMRFKEIVLEDNSSLTVKRFKSFLDDDSNFNLQDLITV